MTHPTTVKGAVFAEFHYSAFRDDWWTAIVFRLGRPRKRPLPSTTPHPPVSAAAGTPEGQQR